MKIKFILPIITLLLLSCNKKDTTIINLTNLKATEGYVDVPLSIVTTKENNNYFEYDARATINNDTLGIIIKLKKDIPAGIVNGEPKNVFLENGIEFISKGNESNKLLIFLANKYNLNANDLLLKESQTFTCANLNQKPTNYNNGDSKFKIFLEKDDDYAELFVNFDFTNSIISLNEKDTEYRTPLVKLLKK